MQHETKQKLREILSRTGHVLDVEDFDDIAELDALACKVSDPSSGIDSPLASHVVYVGGTPVYPLTLSHLQYIDEAGELLGLSGDDCNIVALWVATLPDVGDEMYDPKIARSAFKRWARRSRWTESDIKAVINLRFRRATENNGDGGSPDFGALIGLLASEYGESPEYWMREASVELVEAMIADWQRKQNAQAAAYQRSTRGKATPPAPTPKFVAVRRFRECAERIEAKWQRKA